MKSSLKKSLRFHFAGGGTGGHLFPALALADEINRRFPAAEITFWGTKRGIEAKIIPETAYKLEYIPVRGFQRRLTAGHLLFPFVLAASVVKALRVFLKNRPKAVIGTGGYVSGPVVFSAWLLWIPVFIQEQNSYPGVTTRFLVHLAKRVYLTFEVSKEYFRNKRKLRITGNPVRADLKRAEPEEARRHFGLTAGAPVLFVLGGSQGARHVNWAVAKLLPELLKQTQVQVLWSTGTVDYDGIRREFAQFQQVKVFAFISEMPEAYAAASLIVSRAGATTLAELAVCGLPSILIPYPYAAGGHQIFNARSFELEGAAVCLLEKDLTPNGLKKIILDLLEDREKLEKMGLAARKQAKPEAVKTIVDDIVSFLPKNVLL
ncbi:UDP-N-acetylglucosamine--N-acetylmuramyl-(pentapeptide) pyrophosphoryl-undecaprenol N-acetylglucosamine transferase [bacterium BMS3Abin05]|nr:UDP-N-acetylglucosamine--N-acetylmuramyl-(pentapeptide) pyrophosphoryl-undecaprenol N-acetylglucosamine transferase [bacterium BMS3Abin05]GBE27087.1 UDP-N-acetylglucosamine--N-acetylmuramyl-(pentapeptide) pyrophosphoryl-undecaprenol N-acetylglucosamine transferase [bacterium BMS3Bbin03]